MITSSIKTGSPNSHETGPLSADEALGFLSSLNVQHNVLEIKQAALKGALWPHAIKKSAAIFHKVDSSTLAATSAMLNSEIIHSLPSPDRDVMEVLQVVDTEFDTGMVSEVLDELNYDISPGQLLNKLRTLFLVKPTSASAWEVEGSTTALSTLHLSSEKLQRVLIRLAGHYEARAGRERPARAPSGLIDCQNLFTACRLLQIARVEKARRERLRRAFSHTLERHGAFKQLQTLYHHEVAIENTTDLWIHFKYARLQYVTGKYDEAISLLDTAFHKISNDRDNRDEDLYCSLVRLVAEILIEVDQSKVALKIMDGLLEHAEIAEIAGTVGIQAVSVQSWALTKADMHEECIEINDDILDKRFGGLSLPFSRAVSKVRVGVALRQLGRIEESTTSLKQATEFFGGRDARAYGWSMLNLALTLHKKSDFAGASAALKKAIETNAAYNLFNLEMNSFYSLFQSAPQYASLHSSIASEMDRIAGYENARRRVGAKAQNSRLVQHILLDLEVDPDEPYAFDKAKYELMSHGHPHSMSSKFNQSLINNLRKEDIEPILDAIFASTSKEKIFRSHIYNRVIINGCKDALLLSKKFIYPFVEIIKARTDSVLFSYARFFESVKDIENAEALLREIKQKNSFSYYNIRANCVAKSDPEAALTLNDEALKRSATPQQKAQILHNKAMIVYDHRLRFRFPEAKEWCEESIRRSTKPRFHWPRNTLLKLNLSTCDLVDIQQVIVSHKERFRVSNSSLKKVVSELTSRSRRDAAVDVINGLESNPVR